MVKLYVVIQKVTLLDSSEEFTYWPFMDIDLAERFIKYNKRDASKLGVKIKQYLEIWEVTKKECNLILNSAIEKNNTLFIQETIWRDDYD